MAILSTGTTPFGNSPSDPKCPNPSVGMSFTNSPDFDLVELTAGAHGDCEHWFGGVGTEEEGLLVRVVDGGGEDA